MPLDIGRGFSLASRSSPPPLPPSVLRRNGDPLRMVDSAQSYLRWQKHRGFHGCLPVLVLSICPHFDIFIFVLLESDLFHLKTLA